MHFVWALYALCVVYVWALSVFQQGLKPPVEGRNKEWAEALVFQQGLKPPVEGSYQEWAEARLGLGELTSGLKPEL